MRALYIVELIHCKKIVSRIVIEPEVPLAYDTPNRYGVCRRYSFRSVRDGSLGEEALYFGRGYDTWTFFIYRCRL